MSLTDYIPIKDSILNFRGKNLFAIGIKSLFIDIDKLKSIYEIWLSTVDAQNIVAVSDNAVTNALSMTPTDMNEGAIFIIDDFSINCSVKHYAYHSIKHAYLVRIEFDLYKDMLKNYIYDENSEEDRTRFDLLDL